MRVKKGVTMLMLVIIIIVMTILLSIVSIVGSDIYNSAIKAKLKSEINQIEILVSNYITRNSGINFDIVELDISKYSVKEKEQFVGENTIDNKISLYVVNLDAIDAEEVAYGSLIEGESDRYLYSSTTKRVYYEKGINVEDIIYHRIEEAEDN